MNKFAAVAVLIIGAVAGTFLSVSTGVPRWVLYTLTVVIAGVLWRVSGNASNQAETTAPPEHRTGPGRVPENPASAPSTSAESTPPHIMHHSLPNALLALNSRHWHGVAWWWFLIVAGIVMLLHDTVLRSMLEPEYWPSNGVMLIGTVALSYWFGPILGRIVMRIR